MAVGLRLFLQACASSAAPLGRPHLAAMAAAAGGGGAASIALQM